MQDENRVGQGDERGRSLQELALQALAAPKDERVFDEIHRRLIGPLMGWFRKYVRASEETVEELTGQTVEDALLRLRDGGYDPSRGAKFITFVFSIAKYKRRDWLKEYNSRREMSISNPDASAAFNDEDEPPFEAGQVEDLRECLKAQGAPHSLTNEERFVLDARSRGKNLASLSEMLNLPVSTIHRRYKNGLRKLCRCMAAKGHKIAWDEIDPDADNNKSG
ncbi:MAG: sigma-70 family RNA polymerase sigma factor [Phycisphaerales bacterium]|nr:sigma-70 family RNA polymerase sigma factor [Phycisphaerales bacterium]